MVCILQGDADIRNTATYAPTWLPRGLRTVCRDALQPWSAWRNGRSASATAAVSMDDAPKHHQMKNAHKIGKMKMLASMAQQNTLMYHHHHKESARDSSQAAKREDPTVILPTLIMNWRRRNAEEANAIIYPDWETKQQPPSYAWSMADANFKLPSNATLQGALHRLVRPRPTFPLLTRIDGAVHRTLGDDVSRFRVPPESTPRSHPLPYLLECPSHCFDPGSLTGSGGGGGGRWSHRISSPTWMRSQRT